MTLRPLPRPVSAAEQYLAAVVDRLDHLTAAVVELNGRLGPSVQPPTGQSTKATMRLREPDAGPSNTLVETREPDLPEPPRHGKGSSRDAWAAHADGLGVSYPQDASQRDIIAAIEAAKNVA